MRRLVLILISILLLNILPGHGDIDIPVDAGGGSSSGGGHRQIDFDRIFKALQEGKVQKPQKFEDMKKLLWKEPITSDEYVLPTVLMYYKANNTTLTRNEPVEITTVITNQNPSEIRRALYLYLEVQDPGEKEYRSLNSMPEIVQTNEYGELTNTTIRTWGVLPSFDYLKTIGQEKVRVKISDGVNKWYTSNYTGVYPPYYRELVFNITNSQPKMSNLTITPSGAVRYNDPIEYRADIEDLDDDMLNVTLHVLDQQGAMELKNVTLQVKGSRAVGFKANEYGLFGEVDAGKNFTYNYSFDDGITSGRTDIQPGPAIRRGPKLFVDKLDFAAESENYYWWQWYTFSVRTKNLNPEEFDVVFTLYTNTKNNPWTVVESKTVRVGPQSQVIYFNKTKPFVVTDANESFSYRIKFSERDQSGKDTIEAAGPRINSKIVPYALYHPVMIMNLALMLLVILGAGLFIERNIRRGIESQESASGKHGNADRRGTAKSGSGTASKIWAMFRRGG